MKVINNNLMESKHVTFEPGNATRYDLVLTKIKGHAFVITDLNEKKTVLVNPDFVSADGLEIDLVEAGYGRGDARPMAEFLEDALTQNAYIIYERHGGEHIRWFKNTEQLWGWELEDIREHLSEHDGQIIEIGVIWDY